MNNAQRKPYDYFRALDMLRDKDADISSEKRDKLKKTIALNVSDPEAAALYVDLSGDEWANIYPPVERPKNVTTGNAIETFLDTFGKTSPQEEELLERLIFNPVPEYSGLLERNEKENKNAEKQPAIKTSVATLADMAKEINHSSQSAQNNSQNSPLSFELAKIFVKQGHFERAYDIISKIILNNPEKNIYFADQLRFLEKLIKIKQSKI